MSKKTIAIIVLAAIILAGALVAHFTAPSKPAEPAQKFTVPNRPADYSFGATTPKVTIVEFADFECPFCRDDYTAVREISYKYQKSVRVIFKDFPLHDTSLDLAMAARCAGEQGFFWPMYDKLFALQDQFATTTLPDLAVSVGANKTIFANCFNSRKYLTAIRADYADGQALGVSGTPTFFINGYKVVGEIPEANFEEIVQQFLK
ncbi:MAG TPA: thioredoxin domain-containing protein [Candidatus Nanoarchaeia archaeon]|nr:thioredoxin domain-containing protein [Candidatus Nanoarchaeia archaeon]